MGYSTGRKPWSSEPPSDYSQLDVTQAGKAKLFYFGLVIVVTFAVLTLQLARMQLVQTDKYRLRAETNRLREVPLEPTRGLIYDRNGVPLVENKATYDAAVVAADVPKDQEQQITIALQDLIGVPADDIAQTIDDRRASNDPFTPQVVKNDLPEATAFSVRERLAQLPGIRLLVQPERAYPTGSLLAQVLGFVGPISADQYKTLASQGYQINDRIGETGVELNYEAQLRGTPGVQDVEADASGRELRVIDETPAKPGQSLVLGLDVDLQQHVQDFLQQQMGDSLDAAAVVIDVHTGDILSMVSIPSYDNNLFTGEVDQAFLDQLNTNPAKPLLNHAISEEYAPGSTFKQITGLAALQEGIANAGTLITSNGYITVPNEYNPSIVYTFRDWRSDLGTMNFYRGVAMSSDVYFYELAGGYTVNGKDVFQGLGATKLAEWARKFGLGSPTGIDLPGEADGIVPDPDWKQQNVGDVWTIGDTYNMGIGQGYVTATPLQMAIVTAAVANGGDILTPHVVHGTVDVNGNFTPVPTQIVRNLGVDPRNFDVLREGMRESVADGAAFTAASKNVVIAGKTGTAEYGEQHADGSYESHGWFSGFAPFDNPQVAVAVFLEHGNGQANAAVAGGKILDYYFSRQQQAQAKP